MASSRNRGPTLHDIAAAAGRLRGLVHGTPVLSSAMLAERARASIHLKAELLQRTGSFKPRGVLTKLASLSAGTHAQGRPGTLQ